MGNDKLRIDMSSTELKRLRPSGDLTLLDGSIEKYERDQHRKKSII